MKKLNRILDVLESGGKIRGLNISVYDFRILQEIKEALNNNRHYDFINNNVKNICLSCGLTIKEMGIGWTVSK